MFENPEIAVEDLPKAENVEWQDMDPKFARRKLAEAAITFSVILLAVVISQYIFSVVLADDGPPRLIRRLLLAPLALAVPLFGWPLISVPKKGYAIRDKDILYKSGVFWRTVTAIPFNRIQHVEKSSTPLDRKFNLASLQLYTAGGSGGDLQIHGLPARVAEKLRVFILDKIGSTLEQN